MCKQETYKFDTHARYVRSEANLRHAWRQTAQACTSDMLELNHCSQHAAQPTDSEAEACTVHLEEDGSRPLDSPLQRSNTVHAWYRHMPALWFEFSHTVHTSNGACRLELKEQVSQVGCVCV